LFDLVAVLSFGGTMEEDRNKEPAERMRTIISSSDDESNAQFQPVSEPESEPEPELEPELEPEPEQNSQPQSQSLLDKLPHMKPASQAPPEVEQEETPSKPEATAPSAALDKLPRSNQPAEPLADQPATQPQMEELQAAQDMPRRERFLRALWTMASAISMIVNVVVLIFLVIAIWAYREIQVPEGLDATMVNKLLSGLYSNFEKMDRATIRTVIPVDAQIPLDITVPVQTTTQITLSETVNIPNAQVVINTGGLNINSTARVTLPAGTPLTVNLNFDLPVQDTIPVHLDVPVNIPMANTELHEPFVGLQDVVRPLYCLVDPNATGIDTQLVCR
jgi:hypothetical protein